MLILSITVLSNREFCGIKLLMTGLVSFTSFILDNIIMIQTKKSAVAFLGFSSQSCCWSIDKANLTFRSYTRINIDNSLSKKKKRQSNNTCSVLLIVLNSFFLFTFSKIFTKAYQEPNLKNILTLHISPIKRHQRKLESLMKWLAPSRHPWTTMHQRGLGKHTTDYI